MGGERAAGSVRCFRVPFCLFWILFNKKEPGHFPPNNPPPLQKTRPTSGATAEPLGGDKRTSRRFTWWRRVEGGLPVCFVFVVVLFFFLFALTPWRPSRLNMSAVTCLSEGRLRRRGRGQVYIVSFMPIMCFCAAGGLSSTRASLWVFSI